MRIHNLYVDDKGETHFRDIEVEWKTEGRGGKMSAVLPATGIIFRETPGSYDYEWHPAPRRRPPYSLRGIAWSQIQRPVCLASMARGLSEQTTRLGTQGANLHRLDARTLFSSGRSANHRF